MQLSEILRQEFELEMANTRKVLERIPEDKLGWRPHEKSFTLGELAAHLVNIPGWATATLTTDSYDLAPPGGPAWERPTLETTAAILAFFDENVAAGQAAFAALRDEQLPETWTLLSGGTVLFSPPRLAVVRSFILNHTVHHRAQLEVYLRLNDVPLPPIYGPTADEHAMPHAQ